MSRFSKLRTQFARQPKNIQAVIAATAFFAGLLAFTVGVGGATLTEAAVRVAQGKSQNPIVIESQESNATPTMLKVEIVRNGNTICQGEKTPAAEGSEYNQKFTIERPIADCPPLRVGDTVRATWIQQSEVNISFKD